MKKIYLLIILLLGVVKIGMAASGKEAADMAYQENNYKLAIELYQTVLNEEGESAAVYYNLGNSYFKLDSISKAILNYERALLLDPNDEETLFNLEMAKSKTIDKIVPKSQIFIKSWIDSIVSVMNERGWAEFSIFSFIVFLSCLATYIFSKKIVIKKIGFSLAVMFLIFVICGNIFGRQQKTKMIERNYGIVIEPTVTIRSTPNESGTELFVIHEGVKVFIEDNTMKSWKEISLEDGNRGWIQAEMIEII